MNDPHDGELETAVEMAAALRSGQVGAAELVERAVRRMESWQPVINAFSQRWGEEAVEVARRLDAGRRADPQPLEGIPLAVKDLYDVAGRETTGCCAAYRGTVAAGDAPIVAAVRSAGAVLVGKTNQHELAAGGTNLVSACGRTGNPWDPARITGGSSGGSGAAVAAGIVPLALGSDTGGSIRIPASMCGTFGLKPTHGRLSLEGLMPLAPSMDCPGPMAATVGDLRLLYRVMAAHPSGAGPQIPPREPERRWRLGLPGGFFARFVHPETLAAVERAAAQLGEAGMLVEEVDGSGLRDVRGIWMEVCGPEFAAAHPALAGRLDEVSPQPRSWLELGLRQGPVERAAAAAGREAATAWFRDRLSHVDALIIPTTPYPAFPADADRVDLGPAWGVDVGDIGPGWLTCSVNLAGLPALSLPAGHSSQGLPIGVSLVGRTGGEEELLQMAERWAEASAYRPERPLLPGRTS